MLASDEHHDEVIGNHFFHIGYANYKTWALSTLQLFACDDEQIQPGDRRLLLKVGERDDALEGGDFRLLVDAVRESLNLEAEHDVQFYKLIGNKEKLPISHMIPGQRLQVELLDLPGGTSVWKGAKKERDVRKEQKKKKKKHRKRKDPGEPAEPRRGRKKPCYDVEMVEDLGIGVVMPAAAMPRRPQQQQRAFVNDSSSSSSSGSDVPPEADAVEDQDQDQAGDHESDIFDEIFPDGEREHSEAESEIFVAELDRILAEEQQEEAEEVERVCEAERQPEALQVPVNQDDVEEHEAGAAPAPRADALVAAGLGFVRKPGICEVRFDLGRLGEIRYNFTSEFFRAHCPVHDQCMRRRSALASDRIHGQGRPLGLLAHWLETAGNYRDKDQHIRAKPGSFDERRQARDRFEARHGSHEMTKYERDRTNKESSNEPQRIS